MPLVPCQEFIIFLVNGYTTRVQVTSYPDDPRLLASFVDRKLPVAIYAFGVCSFTGNWWQILLSWLFKHPLWNNSRHLHSGMSTRSRILQSDINGQIFHAIPHLNQFTTDAILNLNWFTQLDNTIACIGVFIGYGSCERPLHILV